MKLLILIIMRILGRNCNNPLVIHIRKCLYLKVKATQSRLIKFFSHLSNYQTSDVMVKPIESSFMIHLPSKLLYWGTFFPIPVPPQKPLIVDDRGRQVEGEVGIGPFREGESLSLECNVPGGKWKCVNNGSITLLLPSRNKGVKIPTFPWEGGRKKAWCIWY